MNMTTAMTKQAARMPIISRYLRCRYAMSSDSDRRACVTICTGARPRPTCPALILPPYAPAQARRGTPPDQLAWLTDDMLKPSTRTGGIAARLNQSPHSRGSVGTVAPTSSSRPSMSTGDSLNLKLFTAPTTSPSSIRYTPSRVSPVSSRTCGSTSRMYHRQVSSSARSVDAIISSSVGAGAPEVGTAKIRLSMAGVTGSPASAAECREECRAASEPSWIQAVELSASPLSKTEESEPDACAITNGGQRSPEASGSLYSVTGCVDSCSPTRVPPPALLNTVRPSAASLAPADQYR